MKSAQIHPLKNAKSHKKIVERAYQHEAIRRVAEAFESGKRRALLVMATGSGKTRTTMGLIDVFLQSSYAQKVLFLADRDALVEQALNDGFKAHLPNEPRVRIRTANIDPNKRLYVSTQQTMGVCYNRFSPGAGQHVIVMPNGTPVHVEEYRKRIDQRILQIAEAHPALRAVREGRVPTSDQLIDLERMLQNELESSDLSFSDKFARSVYGLKWDNHIGFLGLLRHVLAVDAIPDYGSVVGRSFEDHITSHQYTGDQIRFLRAVKDIFLSSRRLSETDLHDAPQLATFGRNAVDRLFSPIQVEELVQLTEGLAV